MKLNPDCTRSILLYLEEQTMPDKPFAFYIGTLKEALGEFSEDEIAYHVYQCDYSGLFIGFSKVHNGPWIIEDLSPKAHDFLANIRDDKMWSGVKSVAAKVGTRSMDALVQIASNVVSEIIRSYFGLVSG